MPTEITVYQCNGCEEVFNTLEEAKTHEDACRFIGPTCTKCAHCDFDLRRNHPCPRYNFDTNNEACELFEQARR
ncbi:hypothetical protein CE91St38_29300 [Desulfovibrionaceae bacterium]|nr:hypothetical protein CE91St38_29300 [Desulfovibrionaceae bacterium]GKI13457.1 hypothetical protein CE91St39_29110 [Desulfovibrionaceae bacterium]